MKVISSLTPGNEIFQAMAWHFYGISKPSTQSSELRKNGKFVTPRHMSYGFPSYILAMEEHSTNKAGKYLASKYFCHSITIPLHKKASKMAPETVLSIHSWPEKLLAPHLKCLMIFLKETELRQSLCRSTPVSSFPFPKQLCTPPASFTQSLNRTVKVQDGPFPHVLRLKCIQKRWEI